MDSLDKFRQSGKIARQVKKYARPLVKEGAKALDIAEAVEAKIVSLGGKPAFPVDVSVNDMAAHYVPIVEDALTLKKGDLVKIDLGVHVDGCVTDTAFSVSIGKNAENEKLIKASDEALKIATSMAKPGVRLKEIGAAVEKKIMSYGFEPIRNLNGHGVGEWTIHSAPSIPSFDNGNTQKLKEGQIIAIEPFATTGSGYVKSGKGSGIYSLHSRGNVRQFREVLEWVKSEYKTLPFAKRHVANKFGKLKAGLALKLFVAKGIIKEYSTLPEDTKGCKVSQSEHTVIIADKPEILT
ncbi:type II methionyl aminopeptidase [Candidatus Woesearchaeota archaeon]|nr:type II methionyl aminopeptidase [Candidatus Woesearchaeota archaeon]MBT4248470.1 type II methionyl aminopeptidase [Candidatus Woesearchaeota archaeon]